jgi:membrane-associated HD superfamily phosphohydrolase
LLPASLFVVLAFLIYRKQKISLPENIKLIIFIILINYIPYLILVETRGRYIIPLFPFFAVVFSYILYSFKTTKLFKFFVYTVLVLFLVRLAFGYIHFPAFSKKRAPQKEVAQSIYQTIDVKKKIAFDCHKDKFITAYLDFMLEKPLKKSKYVKDWDYLLTCKRIKNGNLLKVYETRAKTLYLYQR